MDGFDMPIKVGDSEHYELINPTTYTQEIVLKDVKLKDFQIADELFYIELEESRK